MASQVQQDPKALQQVMPKLPKPRPRSTHVHLEKSFGALTHRQPVSPETDKLSK